MTNTLAALTTEELFVEIARRMTADMMDVYLDENDQEQPFNAVAGEILDQVEEDADRVAHNHHFSATAETIMNGFVAAFTALKS